MFIDHYNHEYQQCGKEYPIAYTICIVLQIDNTDAYDMQNHAKSIATDHKHSPVVALGFQTGLFFVFDYFVLRPVDNVSEDLV